MKWIPCKDELPNTNDQVIVCGSMFSFVSIGYLSTSGVWYIKSGGRFVVSGMLDIGIVRYWIPLPELEDELN